MRLLAPVALLAFLGTVAVAAIPKDLQATNTQHTIFAQTPEAEAERKPEDRPTTPPTTPRPTPPNTPGM
ncbi:MAG: hypothetical protein RLZZ507_2683 [Cyanobacteriota bacterium]|jgi:hypothetical protein